MSPDRPRADGRPAVILASASPRRYELLGRLGIDADIRPAEIDEQPLAGERPEDHVTRLAEAKAAAVRVEPGALVIAADTVVVIDGDTLGKPVDEDDATLMLRRLSGREHRVCTGVHVRRDDRRASSVTTTTVRFRALDEREIAAYVGTGEPMDKAGSYGIQGAGGAFVDGVSGSASNVIGLPLAEVVRLAAEVGVVLLPGGRVEIG